MSATPTAPLAAEFGRDLDLAILATSAALPTFATAMDALHGTVIPGCGRRSHGRGPGARGPGLREEVAARWPAAAEGSPRPAVVAARVHGDTDAALAREQAEEMAADREYWAPLRREFESARHEVRGG